MYVKQYLMNKMANYLLIYLLDSNGMGADKTKKLRQKIQKDNMAGRMGSCARYDCAGEDPDVTST